MRSSFTRAWIAVAALAAGHALLRPVVAPVVTSQLAAAEPALRESWGRRTLGSLLGGYSSIAADFFWLKMQVSWEAGDTAQTANYLRLAAATQARTLFFWENGARILAYDLGSWRAKEAARLGATAGVQDALRRDQAQQAIEFLQQGLRHHPQAPSLHVEMGIIYLRRLDDARRAAECFRKASETPAAPAYAARIHAELQRRLAR